MTNNFEPCTDVPNLTILNEDLKKVLDSLPYIAVIVDEEFRLWFANKAVLYGSEDSNREDPSDEFCYRVLHGLECPIEHCPLRQSITTGKIVDKELYIEKDKLWVSSAIYPTGMKTKNGKKIYFHTIQDIAKSRQTRESIEQSLLKQSRITDSSITAITRIVEKRDAFTSGHQIKVGNISYRIADELGIGPGHAKGIKIAGMLHDVGMIGVPLKITSKPSALSQHEHDMIKLHSNAGYEILKDLEFDWPIADIVLQHHERLDGSGYPNGLIGGDILPEARIIAVADVFDAMTSYRPYRPGLAPQVVLDELMEKRDILYDRDAVDACVKLFRAGKIIVED